MERRFIGRRRPPGATVEPHDRARASSGRDVEPVPTDPDSAKAALDRIAIPQDALDRIGNITPRSSLIVTDEALSPETGKGTEFVVLLSGEPQGALKKRRRSPATEFRYARPRSLLLALAFRRCLFHLVSPRQLLNETDARAEGSSTLVPPI